MNKALHTTKAATLPVAHVKTVVLMGLAVLALLVSLYIYFVGKIVFDVVARKGAEVAIRNTASDVSAMQTQYFTQIRSLDLAEAQNFGLTKSANVEYAVRDSHTATLGYVTN